MHLSTLCIRNLDMVIDVHPQKWGMCTILLYYVHLRICLVCENIAWRVQHVRQKHVVSTDMLFLSQRSLATWIVMCLFMFVCCLRDHPTLLSMSAWHCRCPFHFNSSPQYRCHQSSSDWICQWDWYWSVWNNTQRYSWPAWWCNWTRSKLTLSSLLSVFCYLPQ